MNQTSDSEKGSQDSARVLVVEDEDHLAAGLKLNFELEGYSVNVAQTAREAFKLLTGPAFDVIILDVMLPDTNGFEVCRKMRDAGNYTPVLMLTARNRPEDRVEGIDAGADDYLPKPFELGELLARVRSLLRRREWDQRTAEPNTEEFEFGNARVNFSTHEAWVANKPLRLTALELELLRYFVDNPSRVISREELLERVWKLPNYGNTRTVDNFIGRLRKYFEPEQAEPKLFVAVRGAGYRFLPQG